MYLDWILFNPLLHKLVVYYNKKSEKLVYQGHFYPFGQLLNIGIKVSFTQYNTMNEVAVLIP